MQALAEAGEAGGDPLGGGFDAAEAEQVRDGLHLVGAHPHLEVGLSYTGPAVLDGTAERLVHGAAVVDRGARHVQRDEVDGAGGCGHASLLTGTDRSAGGFAAGAAKSRFSTITVVTPGT